MDTAQKLEEILEQIIRMRHDPDFVRRAAKTAQAILSTPAAADAPTNGIEFFEALVDELVSDATSAGHPAAGGRARAMVDVSKANVLDAFRELLASVPKPVALTDAWCDSIADAHRWDTTVGRREMIRAALAASQPAPVGDVRILQDRLKRLRSFIDSIKRLEDDEITIRAAEVMEADERASVLSPAPVEAQAVPEAWAVYWGLPPTRKNSVHFEKASADEAAARIKSGTEVRPLYAAAPAPSKGEA